MKKQHLIKIFAIVSSIIILSSFSVVVYAATAGTCSDTAAHSSAKFDLTKGLIQCGGAGQPCCDFTEAFLLVNRLINWFITISVSIAAITFAIAGGRILFHPDNPGEISAGWEMFRKTLIGMLVILCAWLVVHTVVANLVSSSTNALRFLK